MREEMIYVTPRQMKMIREIAEKGGILIEKLAEIIGCKPEDLMRELAELESKKLIIIQRKTEKYYVLSSIGLKYLKESLPEERVYSVVDKCGDRRLDEFENCVKSNVNIDDEDFSIGLQYLIRSRCLEISKGIVKVHNINNCEKTLADAKKLREILSAIYHIGIKPSEDIVDILRRRKLVDIRERSIITLIPTPKLAENLMKGYIVEKELITVVRPELAPILERYMIKKFDLSIEPPSPRISRKHPFMQFIDDLREIMLNMGFEEVKGPHVESEFWNFDALFQAQDHPAREIHDTFFLKNDLKAKVDSQLMERAKIVHERGWGYKWSPERSMRLILRSQTTAVTARAIYERGPGEYRIFTIDRNFRPENLDAKHSMEFYQLDGAIIGRDINFKHLLYFFKELAAALGIKEVWFKPGYFPFTEPSVEGYIKHPRLGWIEVFPGGMFRPEVMEILGAKGVKAIAWGIGVDRLAMTVLGIDDIRLLFTRDLNSLANIKYRGLEFFTRQNSGKDVHVVEIPL
ncbi:MAG: phenylalanine--tRNA ligase subunit alpha [Desulfurococcaceae archaeon]